MRFTAFEVNFKGENDDHRVSFSDETWHCTCDFFAGYKTCAHTMALERVLEGMLPSGAASHLLQKV
jgi:hypothetical protein